MNGDQINNSAFRSGAAYVFVRDGTNWIQQAYLKASNTGANDNFTEWVAVSGDTVVVGAWLEDSNATGINGNQNNNSASDSGAAYVFTGLGVPPTEAPVLTVVTGPGQITISWTPPAPGFALQEVSNLPATNWSNSPSGATNPITVLPAEPAKFYRLFKP